MVFVTPAASGKILPKWAVSLRPTLHLRRPGMKIRLVHSESPLTASGEME